MEKDKIRNKDAEIQQTNQQEFKEENDFRRIEVVFFKSCAMCHNSRLVKLQSKAVKYDLLVCTKVEPAFIVDAGSVCDAYK